MKNSVVRTQPGKAYAHLPKDENRPLAIGANFHDDPLSRNTQRKSHNLLLDSKVNHAPHTEYIYNGGTRSHQNAASVGRYSATQSGADDSDDADVWDGWFSEELSEEDKKEFVVRMLGYFREKVPESPLEEERVRKVCIKYFVKDDSIAIVEPKVENSGIEQTGILSRRRVPKDGGDASDLVLLSDFEIGNSISIFCQTYHILDMDARSRRYFYEVLGQEVPTGILLPQDAFSTRRMQKGLPNTRMMTADDMDAKRVAEQQLTGIYTKHSNEDIAIAQQFLKNKINEHLAFLALWDDRGSISGDAHLCVIRLFLENFSIEIAEKQAENSGRMTGPILLSRQRVLRPGTVLEKSRYQQHTYGKLMKTDYLCPEDFQIGETYNIFGKPFFIYDADQHTREYMKANCNIELKPAVDTSPFLHSDSKTVMFHVPPPNGFGSEKERRDNWLALVGKTARLDQDKIRKETGRIMNFSARLAKPLVKGDEEREFIITFYRETDELEINEKPRRNSGFLGGRFLLKGKHRKQLPNGTTVLFQPSDFVVGQEVVIFERPFILLDMDLGTKRILEGSDNPTTDDKIKYLVVLLKQQINLRFTRANEAYLALAPNGTLGFKQVKEFLRSSSCDISDEEALLIVQNISPGTNGVISFDDFLVILNASAESMDEASMSARSVKNVNMAVDQAMKTNADSSEDRQRRRELQLLLQHKLIQRKGTTNEQFRLLGGHSANARMHRDAFRRSLDELLHINMGKKDEDMMVSMLFDGKEDENGEIAFKQFQEFVDSTVPV